MAELKTNVLYYGDNLEVLRKHIPAESIDLIYLDPPFNSNRSYNVLFKETPSTASQAQIEAFEDTWHWGKVAQDAFEQIALRGGDNTARLLQAMVGALGHNDVTAYLTMMAIRLVELRRVLKPTGTIWLHCDPTAGHYLKVLMDSVFGARRFIDQVVWKRSSAHSDVTQGARHFGRIYDLLLVYSASPEYKWRTQYTPYSQSYIETFYRYVEPETGRRYQLDNLTAAKPGGDTLYEWRGVKPYKGRYWAYSREKMEEFERQGRLVYPKRGGVPRYKRYLDEMPGVPLQNLWDDIPPIHSASDERLGYPTQKPLGLLERVIRVGSDESDVVLDPFCGCGTAVHAAQKLGRRWIGIDITHLAIGLIRRRMEDAFPGIDIEVIGEPVDLAGAQELAARDPYQFQWWALDRLGALPLGDRKKGSDRGIDGVIPFLEGKSERRRVIVQVKSGAVGPSQVRDLKGVLDREGEPIGVLLTLRPPTREMVTEAIAAGRYRSDFWQQDYPRLQIITVEELLRGERVDMPPQVSPFAQAARERSREGTQAEML
ncbi:MAG TPA: DNA methyltransferase [Dehalococcoidia bacterium]|nr:DNA methyltransferase [Dehalococcoidia bacterium]